MSGENQRAYRTCPVISGVEPVIKSWGNAADIKMQLIMFITVREL
jgi:hypothetical protein